MIPPGESAEIVSVGDELVSGVHVDLNAPRLARGLLGIGVSVRCFTTVPDDRRQLAQTLLAACGRSALVLVSGGLGPTEDDITRHAAADAAGAPLEFDASTWDFVAADLRRRGRAVRESDKLSATFPRGATVVPNGSGTAPGFKLRIGEAWAYFLPGPPGEAEQMLETRVLPELSGGGSRRAAFAVRRLHLFGLAESELGEKLAGRMARGRNPQVGDTVRKGTITVHIRATGKDYEEASRLAEREAAEIRALFGRLVFGEEGTTLQESLGRLLLERRVSVATAESCTGGLVGKLLTDVPGISEVYRGGFIVYANELKRSALGVPEELLRRHGAVSGEAAQAMAEGVARVTGADLAISVTGIAGPGGGSAEKPVGLVYVGTFLRGRTEVEKRLYPPGDRKRIRELAARQALFLARARVISAS